jgi:signal transduction histidine kinase
MDKPQAENRAPAKKIMVVEDEFITATALKSHLLQLGYEVVATVDSGAEAIRKAAELRPDLILMDIVLLGAMSGIEAACEIKQTLDVPVVYLTAHTDAETLATAKLSEPFGYLPKPCNVAAMMSTIEMALYKSAVDKERRSLEAQLQQARQMESVGRLAGGVAHYLNNMLMVILGYADMVQESLAPTDPRFGDIQHIMDAGKRSAQIVQQLLAFASKQSISRRIVNVNDLILDNLKMLRQLAGEEVELLWLPGESAGLVTMDVGQLVQVVENLVANARAAIHGHGRITIQTAPAVFDQASCADRAGFIPGSYLQLAVSDNGCGMDQETLAQIFEPFFTTRPQGEGMGLGLATVHGIVKQNNGFIDVVSAPGQGTTCTIYLPCNQ